MGRRVAALEGGGARDEGEEESNAAGEPAKRRSAPWRDYPDLLTLEPAEGDEEVFGGRLASHRRVAGVEECAPAPRHGLRVADGP